MAGTSSDIIAAFIRELLDDSDGTVELQRGSLAERFDCVPSQINYVIHSRFSPERGYLVESRRGEGGYIRITRARTGNPQQVLMHTVNCVGSELDLSIENAFLSNAMEAGAISRHDACLILAATGDKALRDVPLRYRDGVRASIFKYMLMRLVSE